MRYWFLGKLSSKRIYFVSYPHYRHSQRREVPVIEELARNSRVCLIVGLFWGEDWETERVRVR